MSNLVTHGGQGPRHERPPSDNQAGGDKDDKAIARSSMHNRYGGIMRRFFEWFFGPIRYPDDAADKLRELAKTGTLVYVAHARTSLFGLYFNHALTQLGLPLAYFVGGINLLLFQPIDRLWKLWKQRQRKIDGDWVQRYTDRPPTPAEALLIDISLRGDPSFLFLRPPRERDVLQRFRLKNDYLRALVTAQRVSKKPIFVVPHALISKSQGASVRGSLGTRIFGSGRRRGRLQEIAMLLTATHTNVRIAEPINLQELANENPDADDQHLARKLSHELRRRISEEERVVAGPDLPAYDTTKRHVLRSELVRATLETVAQQSGKSIAQLERRAESNFREIAARYSVGMVRSLAVPMDWIFQRLYDGIVVDEEGLAKVIEAARKGPLIFCPSHKSHIDYLVADYVFWKHGINPPHIAAGANLSFFPIGGIFRRGGAFFLRRSFKDDQLYGAVFRSYVAELIRSGTSVEFFMEGGRSRTGKLLMPRFGMLGMVIDAWRVGSRSDVQFVPVSIDYERIIEASSYEHELMGGEKKPEDIGALFRAAGVLRSRYGRVYLQFGEPISLAEEAKKRGLSQENNPLHDDRWKSEVERLGFRIMYQIGQAATVTPTAIAATALLGHQGRGLPQSAFLGVANAIVEYLDVATARLSSTLANPERRQQALLEAVQKLVDEGQVTVDRAGRSDVEPIYRVKEERRIILDYHKNALMNYFAPGAVIARALVKRAAKHGDGPVDYQALHDDARFLSRLFKREFVYRVDADFDTHFDDALATLAVRGLLDVLDDGTVMMRDARSLDVLGGLLDSFVESYYVTVQTLADLRQFPLWDKELAMRALERARRAFLEGTITRPEAANRTLIENALSWLLGEGVLTHKTDAPKGDGPKGERAKERKKKRLAIAAEYDNERLGDLVRNIGEYL